MIHDNIELHNTVELEDAAGGGVCLRRIPKAVRKGAESGPKHGNQHAKRALLTSASDGE